MVQALLEQVAEIQPRLTQLHDPSADGLNESLEHYLPLVQQVIAQTQTRVLHGKPAAAREKVLSLFEPHTALIRRGKAKPKETEFGRKVWYAEVEGGLVSEYRLLKGNPHEAPLLLPSLRHHGLLFGKPPEEVCGDRGIHSSANEERARLLGVQRISLPQPGYKSDPRRDHEHQSWFRTAQAFRNGIEGRISQLRRARHLDRGLARGEVGMERWIGWGIIANNLATIVQFLIQHHRSVPLVAS